MQDFKADLHCHTTCSDGTLSPVEIIQLAKQKGLNGLSITDHDSINSYAQAIPAAHEAGIPLISGVEFSAMHRNISVHVLGYSFDLKNEALQQFCQQHRNRRNERNALIIEKLNKHKMPLTLEDVLACSNHPLGMIGRPHIALAMIKKGYVASVQEAFKNWIGEGCPCYAAGKDFSVEDTINIIHQANGFAIIAHPHLIKQSHIVQELIQMNFDGIECYYGNLLADQNKRWIQIAKQKNWIITGGSDYHGDTKPNLLLGASWIGEETFKLLGAPRRRAIASAQIKSPNETEITKY